MELIRGLHNLHPSHRGCVLTIGNFDGVHLGHQAIIAQLTALGQSLSLPTLLLTFEPPPQAFFAPQRAPARLTRLREKLFYLGGTALQRVLCLRFDQSLAMLPPQAFIERLLLDTLGARCVVVGDDFRFGHQRAGDIELLRQAGAERGFQVCRSETYTLAGERVSSTRVRTALAEDDLSLAAALLGRRYAIHGRVAYGERIGRRIGFPTANIALKRRVTALSGVYAVRVLMQERTRARRVLSGVANIGKRPTVDGLHTRLEVHLFDFNETIYGRSLQVEFIHKIRAERRFESLIDLQGQIQHDCAKARAFFAAGEQAGTC